MPNKLESIGNYTFIDCKSLKTIKLPSKLKETGLEVFMNSGLTQITLPANLEVIDDHAFNNCKNLKSIKIKSKKLRWIGDCAFYGIHKKAVFDVPNKYIKKYSKMIHKGGDSIKKKVK